MIHHEALSSWGRYPPARQQPVRLAWADDPLPICLERSVLPRGLGRSYGDVCLNDGGILLLTRELSHFLNFDRTAGKLRAEAGVSLAEILRLTVPAGWFLPVTPGTQFVTLGGAIANDVHGKNHHCVGTFGRHVLRFELLRSTGERLLCSPNENPQYFAATIGGLGLTGLVTWAEIQLIPIKSPGIRVRSQRFETLSEFFELSDAAENEGRSYVVAWVDALAAKPHGVFFAGDHASLANVRAPRGLLSIPFDFPSSVMSKASIRLFNSVYSARHQRNPTTQVVHFEQFFYPLDRVRNWNRIYGHRGFVQWQAVFPRNSGREAVSSVLRQVSTAGSASFLAVLKVMGNLPAPGLLSFSKPGPTVALDFPFRGEATLRLLTKLDAVVKETGGAIYPAKDSRMSSETFQQSFPAWQDFSSFIDPSFSSSFWRRVTGE